MSTLSTSRIAEDMKSIARERYNSRDYTIVNRFPPYVGFEEKVFLGQFSYTTTRTRQRILTRSSAEYPLCEVPQTPTEIARDYLDVVFQKRLRATREQRLTFDIPRSAPLHYQPAHILRGCYVDVQSAYFQILNLVGWDCDYFPQKYLGMGRPCTDFPAPQNKIARNSLVSSGLSYTFPVWTGHKLIEQNAGNKHINLGLWCVIHDILHAIARLAYSYGAFYINTDGYLLSSDRAQAFQEETKERFGIETRVKAEGECAATGVGQYMVGTVMTKHFDWEYKPPYTNLVHKRDEMLEKTLKSIASARIDKPYLTVLD